MSTVTASTLRPLTEVMAFDIVELWSLSAEGRLECQHYHHSEAVQVVVQRIFPDSAPFHPSVSESWTHNSRQVGVCVCVCVVLLHVTSLCMCVCVLSYFMSLHCVSVCVCVCRTGMCDVECAHSLTHCLYWQTVPYCVGVVVLLNVFVSVHCCVILYYVVLQ